ncbi:MAG: hypothetical protein L6R42_009741 [Xanthoria sp. 1 TBL-2021]|nr:MAG: hypothetical protein L6R42_009741 [Xanthoria sp. 1 TBL-2021]
MTSIATKPPIRFLTLTQVKKLHQIYIGTLTTSPSRDTLLNSALDAPLNIQHYEGETDVVRLAAVLASRIIKNHPFMDGNKRTGLLCANVFLGLNGGRLGEGVNGGKGVGELEAAHCAVADGRLDEVGLAGVYRRFVVGFGEEEERGRGEVERERKGVDGVWEDDGVDGAWEDDGADD